MISSISPAFGASSHLSRRFKGSLALALSLSNSVSLLLLLGLMCSFSFLILRQEVLSALQLQVHLHATLPIAHVCITTSC